MSKKATNGIQFEFTPGQAVGFDPAAFDNAIRTQGVQLVHYRAMRCPVGLIDRYDSRTVHDDHSNCSNGFIYTQAGLITCLFTGVNNSEKQDDIGLLDGSTVQVTAPRFYDDTETVVQVSPFDRLYLQESAITVPHWQLAEAHVSGKDKLSFPVESVIDIMDSRGKRYGVGDYSIEAGQLVWNAGPGVDPSTGKGVVYSIRYELRPYWYVSRVMHQVRIAQIETLLDRLVMRMPQSFMLQREYVFENASNDPMAIPDPKDPHSAARQMKGSQDGGFGPR